MSIRIYVKKMGAYRKTGLAWIIHEHLLRQPILSPGGSFLVRPPRRTVMDHCIKNRPAHQLAGAHKRGALYSARRALCEKPTGRGASWRAWGGRVKWTLRSQPPRDDVHE
ncbi:MAG: hypothetical protein M3Z35_09585 [Nitrospirota bacterium]|nr:hypothetical protein [Nitrospirota bacterium]